MNIIATFLGGQDQVTVNGLHQWDWGRKLEIHDTSLPAVVEVHFACFGMRDAVVRTCSVVNGVATAVIPDVCIEQTGPIVAWVVAISETSGETVRTITLPVISRTRPAQSAAPDATTETTLGDKYTQLLAAVNAQLDAINAQVSASDAYIRATATDAVSTIGTAVTDAETDIITAKNTAEADIQTYLNQLISGQIEPAKADLAKKIQYVGGLSEVPGVKIWYAAQDDCLRFGIPDGMGPGIDEDLGETPLRLRVFGASGDSHSIAPGDTYSTTISADAWTTVIFSIRGVVYESEKFKFTNAAEAQLQIALDINKYLCVERCGTGNSFLAFYNNTGEDSYEIEIIAVYQYNC